MSDDLKIVTTVSSEAEAELVRDRLLAADIHAISQRTIGGPEWGFSGARDVFVDARDLERAHEVLEADEGSFSDEELARLSDEAAQRLMSDEKA
jgi:regulator of sirC expression with transglutaminase-like and TPR domain